MKHQNASSPESPPSDAGQQQTDPPPRSRNAKAQARHRAKRKAYIEQLEQTVSRLQAALSVPPEQLGASNARVQELEQENMRLHAEIDMLKAQLGMSPVDHPARRTSMPFGNSTADLPRAREGKRRRLSADTSVDANLYLATWFAQATALALPFVRPLRFDLLRELVILVSLASQASTTSGAQDASATLRNVPILSLPSLPHTASTFPGVNTPNSSNATTMFGYSHTNAPAGSTTSSPYSMASTFSTLSDPMPPSRRSLDTFRDPGDSMRLPQPQPQSQQQLPPLGVGYTRRTPDPPGYAPYQDTQGLPDFNLPSEQPDLGAWRGYTSYARGP
ncbi:hypothetical protein EXIGLDRAFT_837176 [Exidia glandulosa HHB12029]|uniref:BZIP domain-containing protein n=1 Tax=Exidia glandulosa HHB12029 TaxID=1314781 RepID=A0A165H271_EXIGL|nr:hypothetical protein EXIGLDRAFT_837176 [Exidia glandulosa HHB12029]